MKTKLLFFAMLLATVGFGQIELFKPIPTVYSQDGMRKQVYRLDFSEQQNLPSNFTMGFLDMEIEFNEVEIFSEDFDFVETTSGTFYAVGGSRTWIPKGIIGSIYTSGYNTHMSLNGRTMHPVGVAQYVFEKDSIKPLNCPSLPIPEPVTYSNTVKVEGKPCIEIYVEVDYDIYVDFGKNIAKTVDYIISVFTEVHQLYQNENIDIKIGRMLVNTSPKYNCDDSIECLDQFDISNVDENVAILLSYQASGGVAYLTGLCHDKYKKSFASIQSSFSAFPSYSWTVMVITHELGHLFGSHHTHACVWNGNNTAIDGCAGGTEGSCPNPGPAPRGEGTIMSYCHFQNNINLVKGFGPQPGDAIRSFISRSSCVGTCEIDKPDEPEADSILVKIELDTDMYPHENTLTIKNINGVTVINEKLTKQDRTRLRSYTFKALPKERYVFNLSDSYGDGMTDPVVSDWVPSIRVFSDNILINEVVPQKTSNQQFFFTTKENNNNIVNVLIDEVLPYRYQNKSTAQLLVENNELYMQDNAWGLLFFDESVQVAEGDLLQFEYKSDRDGEIHGIGFFDRNDRYNLPSQGWIWQLHGSQNTYYRSNKDYYDYEVGEGWKTYSIRIHDVKQVEGIMFVADEDRNTDNNAYFRNIQIIKI